MATAKTKTVIWFGNAGTPYGDFGLPNLRIVLPALRAVAHDIPLKLVCVSNDRAKFDEVTAGSGIACEYVQWSREECMRRIQAADVCVAPNSRDRFSIVKSANRLVLALSLGTPVVATSTPAAACLAPYVIFDDWEEGIRIYLADTERAKRDAEAGRRFVKEEFSSVRLADRWASICADIAAKSADVATMAGESGGWTSIVASTDDAADLLALLKDEQALKPARLDISITIASKHPELLAVAASAGVAVQVV